MDNKNWLQLLDKTKLGASNVFINKYIVHFTPNRLASFLKEIAFMSSSSQGALAALGTGIPFERPALHAFLLLSQKTDA